jgi:hypothetical protein
MSDSIRSASPDYHDAMSLPAKTLGLAAFAFFFLKGLLWLLVPAALLIWGC